jgi:hypothetical protein
LSSPCVKFIRKKAEKNFVVSASAYFARHFGVFYVKIRPRGGFGFYEKGNADSGLG